MQFFDNFNGKFAIISKIVVPRGFKGVLATEIWSEMGVGFGLLVELGKAARYRNGDKAERRGIGRVLGGIEGVWRNAGYNGRGVEGIIWR